MLGSIRGTVILTEGLTATIEAGGIGYEVELSSQAFASIKEGQECFLYLHQLVREDAHLLCGFKDTDERRLFRLLIKVSGIGYKTALAVLSTLSPADFKEAVQHDRPNLLMKVPGIGRKSAERLIVELKDRLKQLDFEGASAGTAGAQSVSLAPSAKEDALNALIGLGYKEAAAEELVKSVYEEGMEAKTIIVKALALISKRKSGR